MNKKGEFITLSIIMGIIIVVGFIFIEDKLGERQVEIGYIGDNSVMIAYNVRSNNPNCNIDNITINQNNIEYFRNANEIPQDYTRDENCN